MSAIYRTSTVYSFYLHQYYENISYLRELQPCSYNCVSHLEKHQPFNIPVANQEQAWKLYKDAVEEGKAAG
jgi:hypothetical protein